jgi:hypothetical protein
MSYPSSLHTPLLRVNLLLSRLLLWNFYKSVSLIIVALVILFGDQQYHKYFLIYLILPVNNKNTGSPRHHHCNFERGGLCNMVCNASRAIEVELIAIKRGMVEASRYEYACWNCNCMPSC